MYRQPSEVARLEMLLADSQAEARVLRHQLDSAADEALRLRHKLEQIYTVSYLALENRDSLSAEFN